MKMRFWLSPMISSLILLGCGKEKQESDSNVEGLWTPFADALGGMSSMKPKPSSTIKSAEKALQRSIDKGLLRSASAPGSLSASAFYARSQLSAGYVETLTSVGGIPRSQGEAILKKIVAQDSIACGGVTCSRIFGLDTEDISPFMNQTLVQSALSPSLSLSQNSSLKHLVLESLKPDQLLEPIDSFTIGIAKAASHAPLPLPKEVPPSLKLKLSPQAITAKAGDQFVNTIKAYTEVDFRLLRQAEVLTLKEAKVKGIGPEAYIKNRLRADIVNDGLSKLPGVTQPVYRGLSEVSKETLQRWLDKFQKGEVIGLGFLDKGGLASASWKPDVAKRFASRSDFLSLYGGQYGVFFEIQNHRGVSIESISSFARESEVLISGRTQFKIESIGLLEGSDGIFYIKLKGI